MDIMITWVIVLSVLSLSLFIFIMIYMFKNLKSIISTRLMTPHTYKAQISFIIAVLVKAIGMGGSAILISSIFWNKENFLNNYNKFEVIPGGLPGYISSFAFCNILASWCCVYFGHFNASRIAAISVRILEILSYLVLGLFFIFILLMFFVNQEIYHSIEAIVALARDLIISIVFTVFIIKVHSISDRKQGSVMYATSVLIVSGLIFRFVYNILHVFVFSKSDKEFSSTFLSIYVVFFLLSEGMPYLGYSYSKCACSNDKVSEIFYDLESSSLTFGNSV